MHSELRIGQRWQKKEEGSREDRKREENATLDVTVAASTKHIAEYLCLTGSMER